MLSQKTIDIVKATVPALKERGVEITQVFYKNMLGENPDIRAMFDPEKQKDGSQPKYREFSYFSSCCTKNC